MAGSIIPLSRLRIVTVTTLKRMVLQVTLCFNGIMTMSVRTTLILAALHREVIVWLV